MMPTSYSSASFGTNRHTIVVFGISGVGKTTCIRSAITTLPGNVLHLQASQLIKDAKARPAPSESLRKATPDVVRANQNEMVIEFKQQVAASDAQLILFDGHSIIDGEKMRIPISVDVIGALHPSIIVFLRESPIIIDRRRQADSSRDRPPRSLEDIEDLQSAALAICNEYHETLGVALHILRASQDRELRDLLLDYC